MHIPRSFLPSPLLDSMFTFTFTLQCNPTAEREGGWRRPREPDADDVRRRGRRARRSHAPRRQMAAEGLGQRKEGRSMCAYVMT